MKFRNLIGLFIVVATLVLTATGCSTQGKETVAQGDTATKEADGSTEATEIPEPDKEEIVVKLGINGEENRVWKSVKERLALEGIRLEIMTFSDYIIPNTALADGEIDLNAFQTEIFFKKYLEKSNAELSIFGYTVLAPMGIYPGVTDAIDQIPDGAKIAIPNDESNGGRALILLQTAGLIKVDESKGLLPRVRDIIENPKHIEIIEMEAAQIPTVLDEVDVAAINNGVAVNAGLSPLKDTIFLEEKEGELTKNYFNIIAVQTKDLERPELKRVLEIYQTDETKAAIEEEYDGSQVPVF